VSFFTHITLTLAVELKTVKDLNSFNSLATVGYLLQALNPLLQNKSKEVSKHLYLFREIPSESKQTLLSIGALKNKLFTIQKGV